PATPARVPVAAGAGAGRGLRARLRRCLDDARRGGGGRHGKGSHGAQPGQGGGVACLAAGLRVQVAPAPGSGVPCP
ncbi:hypothetical protein TSOC_009758, partial [Tetrabaena socialis]